MNDINVDIEPRDIIFILDESGSMNSMGNEPVEAVNTFVNEQKEIDNESTMTLYTFNSNVTIVYDDVLIKNIKKFSKDKYNPSSLTALYDAICIAIKNKLNKEKNKNVICVILTDGLENCSSEYSNEDVIKMIDKAKTEYNWTFIYLGANQDVFKVGSGLGLNKQNCSEFDSTLPGDLLKLTRSTSQVISSLRTSSTNS